MKQLILIRGLPGSGKSTLAQYLQDYLAMSFSECKWSEADDYFNDSQDKYHFNPKYIGEAHDYCQNATAKAMQNNSPCIIVSNTFTQLWEMEPYLEAAKAHGYSVQVLHCEGQFENTHHVPEETIKKMKARWEPYHV